MSSWTGARRPSLPPWQSCKNKKRQCQYYKKPKSSLAGAKYDYGDKNFGRIFGKSHKLHIRQVFAFRTGHVWCAVGDVNVRCSAHRMQFHAGGRTDPVGNGTLGHLVGWELFFLFFFFFFVGTNCWCLCVSKMLKNSHGNFLLFIALGLFGFRLRFFLKWYYIFEKLCVKKISLWDLKDLNHLKGLEDLKSWSIEALNITKPQ